MRGSAVGRTTCNSAGLAYGRAVHTPGACAETHGSAPPVPPAPPGVPCPAPAAPRACGRDPPPDTEAAGERPQRPLSDIDHVEERVACTDRSPSAVIDHHWTSAFRWRDITGRMRCDYFGPVAPGGAGAPGLILIHTESQTVCRAAATAGGARQASGPGADGRQYRKGLGRGYVPRPPGSAAASATAKRLGCPARPASGGGIRAAISARGRPGKPRPAWARSERHRASRPVRAGLRDRSGAWLREEEGRIAAQAVAPGSPTYPAPRPAPSRGPRPA